MPHNCLWEPANNVYGRFKVLVRTDGKWVVHDTEAKMMGQAPVFKTEDAAREAAKKAAGIE